MAKDLRAKFGYLTYEDMIERIESGDLDAYDIVYSKDQHTQYIIQPDLTPLEIKARVDVYASTRDAIKDINEKTSTYEGQLVSILKDDVYRVYIVNKLINGTWTVVPASEQPDEIDYESLMNIPITNIKGTASDPIDILSLADGVYMVKGYYTLDTLKTAIVGRLFFIDGDYVTQISTSAITKYVKNDMIEKKYVTDDMITSLETVIADTYVTKVNPETSGTWTHTGDIEASGTVSASDFLIDGTISVKDKLQELSEINTGSIDYDLKVGYILDGRTGEVDTADSSWGVITIDVTQYSQINLDYVPMNNSGIRYMRCGFFDANDVLVKDISQDVTVVLDFDTHKSYIMNETISVEPNTKYFKISMAADDAADVRISGSSAIAEAVKNNAESIENLREDIPEIVERYEIEIADISSLFS